MVVRLLGQNQATLPYLDGLSVHWNLHSTVDHPDAHALQIGSSVFLSEADIVLPQTSGEQYPIKKDETILDLGGPSYGFGAAHLGGRPRQPFSMPFFLLLSHHLSDFDGLQHHGKQASKCVCVWFNTHIFTLGNLTTALLMRAKAFEEVQQT